MKYYIIFEFHSKKTFLFLGGFRNRLLGTNHSVFIYIYAEKSENIAIRMFFQDFLLFFIRFLLSIKKNFVSLPLEHRHDVQE
jgi:hypothetical protein